MPSPTIVWLRNDLRIEDSPALSAAAERSEQIVPVFILDDALLRVSPNRTRFLLESLENLKHALQRHGADLVIRSGEPKEVLQKLAHTTGAETVYYAADYTPYARTRDDGVDSTLREDGITTTRFPGRLIIDSASQVQTKSGTPYKVFSPFYRAWSQETRRTLSTPPATLQLPDNLDVGTLPQFDEIFSDSESNCLSANALKGGEIAAKQRLAEFLDRQVSHYHKTNNDMAADTTSRLSAYLHFGCISPLWIESQLGETDGEQAFARQLAWRDFYHTILYNFPDTHNQEFQERYRTLEWLDNATHFEVWKHGTTGYPIVDAAMRQLRSEGWIHNRGRLIVGSFLTKDLQLDWRLGEAHFMRWLIDGDQANNVGNWQWIASVGVDPAPLFRRLYNPSSQANSYDPDHTYIRRFVPELRKVPDEYIVEPWKMNTAEQEEASCVIGQDYPAPIVDHATARKQTIARYKAVE